MNQRSLNFRANRQNFDQRWSNLIMTTIISRTHRLLSRSISRSSNLSRNHRMCLNRIINSQSRTIRNQNLKFFRTHQDVIAIDLENVSHSLHFWILYSMRLSISSSLRSRYSLSLSLLSSIQSYTSRFLISSHSDRKRSTNSLKKMFFN